jgi:hypothetical protein
MEMSVIQDQVMARFHPLRLGKGFHCSLWLFSYFGPVFFSHIFINFDWAAATGMSVIPILFRTGNPVPISALDVVIICTGIRAAFLEAFSSILKRFASSVESDATDPSRAAIIMTAGMRLQFDVHDPCHWNACPKDRSVIVLKHGPKPPAAETPVNGRGDVGVSKSVVARHPSANIWTFSFSLWLRVFHPRLLKSHNSREKLQRLLFVYLRVRCHNQVVYHTAFKL